MTRASCHAGAPITRSLAVALAVLSGCGGEVVVDDTAGAAESSASSGVDCAALRQDYDAKLAAATTCSPALEVVQCDCAVTLPNACGWAVLVNEAQPSLVQAAQASHDAWLAAGCTASECPVSCPAACPGGSQPVCQPSADGSSGSCETVFAE